MWKKLSVNNWFVFQTIKRYRETDDVEDRLWEGCPHLVCMPKIVNAIWEECPPLARMPKLVHAVHERVRQNPLHKQKQLVAKMNILKHSVHRTFHSNLHFHTYQRCISHLLTKKLKKRCLRKCKKLLKRFAKNEHWRILFTNEKISIEEKFNCQNDRIYIRSC